MADTPSAIESELFPSLSKKGDRKKIEILEATVQCLAELGVERTNFETIGQKLGMHKSHVKYHFNSREDLLFTVAQYVTAGGQTKTVDLVLAQTHWWSRLQAVLEAAFRWYEEHPTYVPVLMLFYYRTVTDQRSRELYARIRESGRRRMASIVRDGLGLPDGSLQRLEELGNSIQNIFYGHLFDYYCEGRTADYLALKRRIGTQVRLVVADTLQDVLL